MNTKKKLGRTLSERISARRIDATDDGLVALLNQLKASGADSIENRELSHQIERIIFHKQITTA